MPRIGAAKSPTRSAVRSGRDGVRMYQVRPAVGLRLAEGRRTSPGVRCGPADGGQDAGLRGGAGLARVRVAWNRFQAAPARPRVRHRERQDPYAVPIDAEPLQRRSKRPARPKLGSYVGIIERILKQDRGGPSQAAAEGEAELRPAARGVWNRGRQGDAPAPGYRPAAGRASHDRGAVPWPNLAIYKQSLART